MPRLAEFRGIEGEDFFALDPGLQTLLNNLLPADTKEAVFSSLHHCGRLVGSRWNDLAREANKPEHLPKIIKFDRSGNAVEQIDWGSHARHLRREVAEFGVLSDVENELHKFALVYLLGHNGEGSVNCGFSCTDGLIRAIEACGSDYLRKTFLPLLLSVETPLGGAQFVTEQDAGSDIGAIEGSALRQPDGTWSITAQKWFCSNPDEYFLVAARPVDATAGTAGVAVFVVPRVLPDGTLNRISYKRLKDKLGTRSLPTAEIDFDEATGWAIGDTMDGFKTLMTYVINASRVHNSANACGMLHRAFLEARNYARQREAFGGAIIGYPLVQETLVRLLERCWRHRVLTFQMISLLDEHGMKPASEEQSMWQRFLINLAKYRTSVTLTDSIRESILIFGGNGIVEDFTILPRLLRDAMIIETWEGTHNTLCLQMVRDAAKSNLLDRWHEEIASILESWPRDFLRGTREKLQLIFDRTNAELSADRLGDHHWSSANARRIVDRLGSLLEVAWMAQKAQVFVKDDSSLGLLTVISAHELLEYSESSAEHLASALDDPAFVETSAYWPQLIDETPIKAEIL